MGEENRSLTSLINRAKVETFALQRKKLNSKNNTASPAKP
jgi:hypothetical protein